MKARIAEQAGDPPGMSFLKGYETVLRGLLTGFGIFHLFVSLFRYVIPWESLKTFEYITAAVLFSAALVYVIISLLFHRWNAAGIRDFFTRTHSPEQVLLLGCVCCFAVSFFVNRAKSGPAPDRMNAWSLFDAFVNAALFFPFTKISPGRKSRGIVNGILLLLLFPYSAFTVYGLWHALQLSFPVLPSGMYVFLDRSVVGLWLGAHYNITGMQAFLMLFICLYFMTGNRSKWRWLFIPLFLLHLFAANISNSRTVYLTGLIIFPVYLFFYVLYRNNGKLSRKCLLIAFAAAAAAFGFYRISRPVSFYYFEKISRFTELVPAIEPAGKALDAADKAGDFGENIRELNNLSGRREIWDSCLKTMFHDPFVFFFGVTPDGITNALSELGGYRKITPHAHNMVLQVGVSAGVPAMIIYCVFLGCVCLKCIRFLFAGIRGKGNAGWRIPIFILSLTIPSLAENYIVSYHVMAGLFSILAGLVCHASQRPAFAARDRSC